MFESFLLNIRILFFQITSPLQHKMGFTAPASINFERIIDLHHFIFFYLIVILLVVIWLLISLIDNYIFFYNIRKPKDHNVNNLNSILFIYTYNIFKKFKLNGNDLITLIEFNNYNLTQVPRFLESPDIINAKQLIGLNEYLNLYIKSTLSFLIVSQAAITKNFTDNKILEFAWTAIPCFILATISVPSFYVLYINEEIVNPGLTVNIMAHQWYWSYDYTDLFPYWYNEITYADLDIDDFVISSYMEPEEYLNLNFGALRLLDAEEPLILPVRLHIRLVISSFDTLHSFAIPSMGIKVDAIPGRMNQIEIFIKRAAYFLDNAVKFVGLVMDLCL